MCLEGDRKRWQGGRLSKINPRPVVISRVMDHLKYSSLRESLESEKIAHCDVHKVGLYSNLINLSQENKSGSI